MVCISHKYVIGVSLDLDEDGVMGLFSVILESAEVLSVVFSCERSYV